MTAGLDLGNGEFRSLRMQGERLIARRIPAFYTILNDTEAHRRLLEQSKITYSASAGTLVVIGAAAEEMAALMSRPLIPLIEDGHLVQDDVVGRQVTAWLIDLLLPVPLQQGEVCVVALPQGDAADSDSENWTNRFLRHIIELRGYQPITMNPSSALALAELNNDGYSGYTMTFGADSLTFTLSHHSKPVLETRANKGLNDVIARLAQENQQLFWDHQGNMYLNFQEVQRWLSGEGVSLSHPKTESEVQLRDAISEWLLAGWFSMKRKIAACHESIINKPMPLVISGAVTEIDGFSDLLLESIRLSGVSIQIKEVRGGSYEGYSVARGLFIQANLISGIAPSAMQLDAA